MFCSSSVMLSQSSFGDMVSCNQIQNDDSWEITAIGSTSLCGTQTRSMYVNTANSYQETLAYAWYTSTNDVNYTEISNSDNDTLLNQSISVTRYFKCTVYCGTNDSLVLGPLMFSVITPVTPSVSIALTAGTNPTCSGVSLTFTATPTNGGTTPVYQWQVNGSNVATNSPTFTTTSLANGQSVTCVMTSNAACASPTTATSNSILMSVTTSVTPAVSIAQTAGSNPSCSGSSLTFTATPTNGGATPSYQWNVNGSNVGTNIPTFTTSSLTNGQNVTCVMTSVASCASPTTATSNSITVNVTANVTPAVTIALTSGTLPACSGSSLTFTATPTNGGVTPAYQWKVNGSDVGTNSATFTTTSLTNGQNVTCVLTSNAACASPTTATSNSISVTVTAVVTPAVSISLTSGSNPTCSGSSLTFTAVPTNGGSTPAYQWKVNGSNVGTNIPTFTTSSLTNGQNVTCVMTSNAACASPTTATSNSIMVTVQALVTPGITINQTAGSNPACQNDVLSFGIATSQNTGSNPVYTWFVNGSNVGTGTTYSGVVPVGDNNTVNCQLTSNAACATPSQVLSNSLSIDVNPLVTPTVTIAVTTGTNPTCQNAIIGFTATGTGGGSSPTFQWKVNNINVGTGPTYSSGAFVNGDQVTCVLTSNAVCRTTNTATSSAITVLITNSVQPAVSISLTGGTNPSCAGTMLTFTAVPANGGTPSYQWKRNGTNVGTNSPTFSANNLNNNDVITVVMTSTIACANPTTATSLSFTVQIVSSLTPAVSIEFEAPDPFCPGTNVTFNAVPVHGGTSPTYSWTLDGVPQSGSISSFSAVIASPGNHTIQVAMVSNASCLSTPNANSGIVSFSVQNSVVPSVSIISSESSTVCAFEEVTFEVNSLNGQGTTPNYQWRINNVLQPINADNITVDASDYPSGFTVYCTLLSSLDCASPSSANSNTITTTVTPSAPAGVTVIVSDASVCDGTPVNFQATAQQGGSSPSFQWKVNNGNVGTGSFFSSSALNDGDVVTCQVTSSAACASPATATSSQITMEIFPLPEVILSVLSAAPFCETDEIILQSIITQGEFPMSGTISEISTANLSDLDVAAISTVVNSTVLIADFGTYVFDYTELTDNNGCQLEDALPVQLQVIQRPVVTVGPASFVYCEEELISSVPVSSLPSNAQSQYNWVVAGFGSFQSSGNFTTLNGSAIPGGFAADVVEGSLQSESTVCVDAKFNGCESLVPDCFDVTVNAKPHIIELPDTAFCGGDVIGPLIFLANPAHQGIQFDWQLTPASSIGFGVSGGNSISGVIIEPVAAQQRELLVNAELGSCADSMSFQVQVIPTPHITSDLQQAFCSNDGSITIILENDGETNQTFWELSESEENVIGLITSNGFNSVNLQTTPGLTSPVNNALHVTAQDTQLGKTCFGETEVLEISVLHNPVVQPLTPGAICSGDGFISALESSGQATGFGWDASGSNPSLVFHPESSFVQNNQLVIDSVLNQSGSLQNASIELWAVYSEFSRSCFGDTIGVSLNANPEPQIGYTNDESTLCSGLIFGSEITSQTSFPSTDWTWVVAPTVGISGGTDCGFNCQNISDSFENSLEDPAVVNYYFTQFIEGTLCSSLDTLTITINPIPNNQIGFNLPEVICAGSENVLISTVQTPENNLTWSLSPSDAGDLVAGGENGGIIYVSLNPLHSGDVVLNTTITDSDGCTSQTSNTLAINSESLVPDFFIVSVNDGTPGMTLVSLPANANATYQWGYVGLDEGWTESTIPNEQFQDYVVGSAFDPDKLYWVEITLDGCVTKVFFQTLTGTESDSSKYGIVVFPNPVADILNVSNRSSFELTNIELMDQAGSFIKSFTVSSGERFLKMDVGDLSSGIYLLKISSEQNINYLRFIKN
jgi:hypothetical protein